MKTRLLAVAAVLGAFAGAPASAQFYAGFSVGHSDLNPDRTDWTAGPGFTTIFDDSDWGWKIFGGYQFHRNFGLEVAYTDLGRYTATNASALGTTATKVELSSWAAFFTGIAPVTDKFSLMGKLGVSANRAKMSFNSGGTPGFLPSDSASDTRAEFAWGLGASYAFTKQVAVRVEYEDFGDAGTSTRNFTAPGNTGRSQPHLMSVGLQFSF